jgi:hypothetical protein
MRAKARGFRAGSPKGPGEVALALAPVAWSAARRMLASLRKAGFALEAGPAYFAFLAEALAFEVQVAWRLAHERYDEADRVAFASGLSQAVGRVLAANESELLGAEAPGAIEARFIERLNRRFEEYADFQHDAHGPRFGFLRYFASLVQEILPREDHAWVHQQVMAVEGPEAAATIATAFQALVESGAGRSAPAAARAVGE